jgi:hypothetical protein
MAEKIFKKGFLPRKEKMPAEKTHARAKLVYNILRMFALVFRTKDKVEAALREIKSTNMILHDLVKTCWSRLTPDQIQFYRGPRPHFHEDGKLAIYHPQLDNPLIQVVLEVIDPVDADRFGQRQPKLIVPKSVGGIL